MTSTTHAVLAYFNQSRHSMLYGYASGDSLVETTLGALDFDAADPLDAAQAAFSYLNDDERPNGQSERSLSVGDVVRVTVPPEHDGATGYYVWFACEPIGWGEIDEPTS